MFTTSANLSIACQDLENRMKIRLGRVSIGCEGDRTGKEESNELNQPYRVMSRPPRWSTLVTSNTVRKHLPRRLADVFMTS